MSCRCRRRRPLDHYLVAGGPDDLESIQAFLALLPPTAYGQVFLAEDADPARPTPCAQLCAPGRMTLTRLSAASPTDHPSASSLATRGSVLADAVAAWVKEWVPEDPTADRIVSLWIGGRGSAALDSLCDRLPCPVERL